MYSNSNSTWETQSITYYLRYLRSGSSSMAVVELETLSGYQVDPDEVQKLVDSSTALRKVEVENKDTKLITYFDEVSLPECRVTSKSLMLPTAHVEHRFYGCVSFFSNRIRKVLAKGARSLPPCTAQGSNPTLNE